MNVSIIAFFKRYYPIAGERESMNHDYLNGVPTSLQLNDNIQFCILIAPKLEKSPAPEPIELVCRNYGALMMASLWPRMHFAQKKRRKKKDFEWKTSLAECRTLKVVPYNKMHKSVNIKQMKNNF